MARTAEIVAFLRDVRLFREIPDAELTELAGTLRERGLRRGHVLVREGEAGEEMFLVRRGTVVVSKAVKGNVDQVLARIGPGDFFGEMSLFDRSPRSATVQAETDVSLLVLDRRSVQNLIELSPRAAAEFFHALVQVFIERLRTAGDLVKEVTLWGIEASGLDIDAPR